MTHHCHDCCCATAWRALGVTDYTVLSLPEHITALRAKLKGVEEVRDEYHQQWGEALESEEALKEKLAASEQAAYDVHGTIEALKAKLSQVGEERDAYIRRIEDEQPIFESMRQHLAALTQERDRLKVEIEAWRQKVQKVLTP